MPKSKFAQIHLLADGSIRVGSGLALEFDAHEASYIRAAAGNLLAKAPVNPTGLTTLPGLRWLLTAEGAHLLIGRHGVVHRLNPRQVMKVFTGALVPAQLPAPAVAATAAENDLINRCNHLTSTENKVAALRAYVATEVHRLAQADRPSWKSRIKEFEKLENLLREVSAINSGSRALERIARCIEVAKILSEFDLGTATRPPRDDFLTFLRKQFIAALHGHGEGK